MGTTDSLADRLRIFRHELGAGPARSRGEMRRRLRSWQGWEEGRMPEDYRQLLNVAEALNNDRDWLLSGGPLRREDEDS